MLGRLAPGHGSRRRDWRLGNAVGLLTVASRCRQQLSVCGVMSNPRGAVSTTSVETRLQASIRGGRVLAISRYHPVLHHCSQLMQRRRLGNAEVQGRPAMRRALGSSMAKHVRREGLLLLLLLLMLLLLLLLMLLLLLLLLCGMKR